jgi:hypothetical protein
VRVWVDGRYGKRMRLEVEEFGRERVIVIEQV